MRLREVLGDSSDTPLFVETIPRRGYRFIAHVDEYLPSPPMAMRGPAANQPAAIAPAALGESVTAPPAGKSLLFTRRRIATGIAGLVLTLVAGVVAVRYFATRNSNSGVAGKNTTSLLRFPLAKHSAAQ